MSSGLSFSSIEVWPVVMLFALIVVGLIIGNTLKRYIPFLRKSLIPVSVIGGLFLLAVSVIFKFTTGEYLFNLSIFSNGTSLNGIEILEILTYHCLAIGFIAMTLRKTPESDKKKGRVKDVVNSGILTANTYLVQAMAGLTVTIIASFFIPKLLKASGIILCFGFGQGTGQALNYGSIYQNDYGFVGGKSFGLTIAAIGFLAASLGGVIYLSHHKRKGDITIRTSTIDRSAVRIEDEDEIPMVESFDKLTMEIALVVLCYAITYSIMFGIGKLVGPGLSSTIFGFNFLFGTLSAVIVKAVIGLLRKAKLMHRDYINNFLLNRIAGFAFDIMIVAGIGAIQIDLIKDYLVVLFIMCLIGVTLTFLYVRFVSKTLFKAYEHEEFLIMFGMLTGTASTGVILLREIDPLFETPASENVVYQTFPAIVMGFPMMLLAAFCPKSDLTTYITFGIVFVYFVVLNIILFRSKIFKRRKKD